MPIAILASTVDTQSVDTPEELADAVLPNIPAPSPSPALDDDDGLSADDLSTLSVDEPEEDDDDDDDEGISADDIEDLEEVKVYDLLTSFFRLNPEPTDAQLHSLASAIGKSPEDLEQIIFAVMSVMMEDPELVDETRDLLAD